MLLRGFVDDCLCGFSNEKEGNGTEHVQTQSNESIGMKHILKGNGAVFLGFETQG